VNPDVVDFYTSFKKTKTPRKTQKNNNLKNINYQNVNYRGPSFYIQLARRVARPPSVTPLLLLLADTCQCNFAGTGKAVRSE